MARIFIEEFSFGILMSNRVDASDSDVIYDSGQGFLVISFLSYVARNILAKVVISTTK